MDIFSLLEAVRAQSASDLHLSTHSPPLARINGSLQRLDGQKRLTEIDIEEALRQIATVDDIAEFRRELELDFGYTLPDGTRLRCNVARQRGVTSLAIRILPSIIPTIDELGLPEISKKLICLPRGLIVVAGPTGSGKTTTQAAMIQYLNTNRTRHVVSLEDPIEYSHPNLNSTVTQRELGGDTYSFTQALKHVLRHDPDVILVGEMRDTETASAVLSLAETGHLIITTSHARSAPLAVERVIDLFPHNERHLAQMRLSSLLTAVLCQVLVPRADGSGRTVAVEVMLGNSAVSHVIHEGKFNLLPNVIRTYRSLGMVSLDEALVDLYRRGIITGETVFASCNDSDEVKKLIYEQPEAKDTLWTRLRGNGKEKTAAG